MTHPRIFYGWWVVGASVLVGLYVGGIVVYGFTAIFEPIVQEFGWSYAAVSLAASLRGAESGLLEPVMGRLVDRWGPRPIVFAGGLFAAAGLFLLSSATSLATFYGAFLLLAAGMSCCGATVLVTGVANWFRARLGLATGIALSGFGLGGFILPVMVALIDMYGWRATFEILAVGALVIVLPTSLALRHRPEQYGCVVDGLAPAGGRNTGAESRSIPGVSVPEGMRAGQATRTRSFWLLTLAFACHGVALTAIVTHVMPYLDSIGISRMHAGMAGTAIPVISVLGRLGLGTLGDRTGRTRIVVMGFGMMALGTLCFAATPTLGTWALYAFLLLFGAGYGGVTALRPALTREYFGGSHFGSIFGVVMGVNALGGIVGPPVAGRLYDVLADYRLVWVGLSILSMVAAFLVLSGSRCRPRLQAPRS